MNKKRTLTRWINSRTLVSGFILGFYLFNFPGCVYAHPTLQNIKKGQQSSSGLYEKTLTNGLKIIVKPDHRARVVVFQIWYKVGSSYEHSGTTGVSHAMEHMMQKGMKEFYNLGYVNRLLPGIGESNAFSTRDYTTYSHQLEKNRLKDIFHLESWRMHDLVMSPASFKTEIMVIQEERRQQTEDIPEALLYEQFSALAYTNSGYHQPIIGWMTDLKNMQLNDLHRWYQQYYVADNASIIVVGDVVPEEVFRLAEHYFSQLPSSPSVAPKPGRETSQKGSKRFVMTSPVSLAYLITGFQVPSLVTADDQQEAYALDLLASLLDSGENTRLNKNLVRHRKIATRINVEYELYAQKQTRFIIQGVPNTGLTATDLERAILDEIEHLKNQLVSDQELKRIKTQIIASEVFDKDSMLYQAKKTGIAETIGIGWKNDENYVDHILSITPEQLQYVAGKYFISSKSTTALMQAVDKTLNNSLD